MLWLLIDLLETNMKSFFIEDNRRDILLALWSWWVSQATYVSMYIFQLSRRDNLLFSRMYMQGFTKNGLPTISTMDPLQSYLLRSAQELTFRDMLLANIMYGCISEYTLYIYIYSFLFVYHLLSVLHSRTISITLKSLLSFQPIT